MHTHPFYVHTLHIQLWKGSVDLNNPRKKLYLSFRASLVAAVLLAGFYTALCLWCQPGSFFGVSGIRLLQLPVLIVLNAMPVGLTLLAAVAVEIIFYFKLEKINMAEALKSVE